MFSLVFLRNTFDFKCYGTTLSHRTTTAPQNHFLRPLNHKKGAMAKIGYARKPDGQNRVPPSTLVARRHLIGQRPLRPDSGWIWNGSTRFWLLIPIGYPISITPTRLWPGHSTSSPHTHAPSRHRGTRRVIFAVDVVVRAAELWLLCSLYVMRLSLTRVTKSYLLALGTTQVSSYFTKH